VLANLITSHIIGLKKREATVNETCLNYSFRAHWGTSSQR